MSGWFQLFFPALHVTVLRPKKIMVFKNAISCLCVLHVVGLARARSKSPLPNIIIIVADDLGYVWTCTFQISVVCFMANISTLKLLLLFFVVVFVFVLFLFLYLCLFICLICLFLVLLSASCILPKTQRRRCRFFQWQPSHTHAQSWRSCPK